MREYGMNSKGFRLKVGMDSLSKNGTVAEMSVKYGVSIDDVVKCREEALPLHGRMQMMHGPRYWQAMNLERCPDALVGTFSIGAMKL